MTAPNWIHVTLHDISRPKQWTTIRKSDLVDEGFPVYGANGIIGYHTVYNHAEPTILIGCRGSCGSVSVSKPMAYVTGNAMALDDLDERRVDAQYLVAFLRADGLQSAVTGTSQPQITSTSLRRIQVPLPPIDEQRRIAALLDQADELRAKRRTSLGLLDSLNESIFLDMFGDPETNPFSLNIEALGEVALTTSGGTPDRSRRDFYGGGIPWVKSGELRDPVVRSTEESITEEGLRSSSAKVMKRGTVLLAMYGATAGAVSTLGIDATTNQAVCCISVGHRMTPAFLVQCLRLLTPSLLRRRVGGAQPNLSQGLIRSLPIPVPPIEVQERFEERLRCVDDVRVCLASSSVGFEALFSSLQHRAFAGQL